MTARRRPRVTLLAGTLGQGGAEKQLVYLAQALRDVDVDVNVLALTQGEFHEATLRTLGVVPTWVGGQTSVAGRLAAIGRALRQQRPDVLLAGHFYVNLYVRLASLPLGVFGVGTARSDVEHEVRANGAWGRWLLRAPSALLVNSETARRNAIAYGCRSDRVHVLANVIDLARFDAVADSKAPPSVLPEVSVVAAVGSLLPVKRLDRLLRAVAIARSRGVPMVAWIVGDGTEQPALQRLAAELGLLPAGIRFLGRRDDVPGVLRCASMLALTSEHEGFPNAVLEAMAARLPVVCTNAGDAGRVVVDGETGFVIDGDPEHIAARLGQLASSAPLRQAMGIAGRRRVETCYAMAGLGSRALDALRALAVACGARRALAALSGPAR